MLTVFGKPLQSSEKFYRSWLIVSKLFSFEKIKYVAMSAAGANPGDQTSQRTVTYEPPRQQSDNYTNNHTDQRHNGRNEERQHSESRDRSRSSDKNSGVNREHRHGNDQGHQPHSSGQGRQQHRQGQQSQDSFGQGRQQHWQGQQSHDSNYGQWGQRQSQQGFNNKGGSHGYRNQEPQYSRNANGEWSADEYTFLSRTLSSILRHNAERFGFKLMKGGFLYVDDILRKTVKLHGFTLQDVKKVVAENDKKRFALEEEEGGQWKIRANQGHSLEVECLDLKPILSAAEYPTVIHGTYYTSWEMIKKTGLRKMKRNHIHFARGEPGSSGVISGMRSSCEVIIHINMEKALTDGLKFFVSANDVILSEGDKDGVIYPCYFQGAIDRKRTYKLDFDDKIGSAHEKSSESDPKKRKKKNKKNKLKEENDDLDVDGCDNVEEASDQFAKKHEEFATKKEDVAVTQDIVNPSKQDANEINASQSTVDVPNATAQSADDTGTFNQAADDTDANEQAVDDSKAVDTDSGGQEINESWDDCLSDASADGKIEWTFPEFMNAAKSKEVIERLIADPPSFVIVCCVGENLGMKEGHIRAIVVLVRPDIYVYHLCDDNKDLVKEGKLDTLLLEKKIMKVFFNIRAVSRALIQEYDVLLNGIPIWDIELMYKRVTLPKMDLEDLKKQYGFGGSFKNWHRDNETLGSELADPDINEDYLEKVITQGKCITELFIFCHKKMDDDCRRKLRAETYKAAIPGENEELFDKVKELTPQKSGKKQKQANKDSDSQQQQTEKNKQQQGVKMKGNRKPGGGKGNKGKKR